MVYRQTNVAKRFWVLSFKTCTLSPQNKVVDRTIRIKRLGDLIFFELAPIHRYIVFFPPFFLRYIARH